MELGNTGAIYACLVMAIVKPRVGRRGPFMGALPMLDKILLADPRGDRSEPWGDP